MNGSFIIAGCIDLAEGLLRLLFPRICPSCARDLKRGEELICISCRYALSNQCFNHLMQEQHHVLSAWYPNVRVFSLFPYHKESVIQRLLYQVKYRGQREIGIELGRLMVAAGHPSLFESITLIRVPIDKKRLRKRGYNQCRLLVSGMAERLECPIRDDVLIRQPRDSQTHKSREERWDNLGLQVQLNTNHKLLRGKVLLVDDVITTGATLAACLEALSSCNDIKVDVLTLARSDEL